MSMFGLGVFLIFLWLLAFLYRKIPNKSIFFLFLLVLIVSAGIAAYSVYIPDQQNATEQRLARERIIAQQEIFGTWYAEYQKALESLDYNWQQQDQILTGLRNEEIDQEIAFYQLTKLEEGCQALLDRLARITPPASLTDENYYLALQVHGKTTAYAEAQLRTVQLCRQAADPEAIPADEDTIPHKQNISNKKIGMTATANTVEDTGDNEDIDSVPLPPPQNDLNHRLRHIMLTEAPAGLFTAEEISALRINLSLPEELKSASPNDSTHSETNTHLEEEET